MSQVLNSLFGAMAPIFALINTNGIHVARIGRGDASNLTRTAMKWRIRERPLTSEKRGKGMFGRGIKPKSCRSFPCQTFLCQ